MKRPVSVRCVTATPFIAQCSSACGLHETRPMQTTLSRAVIGTRRRVAPSTRAARHSPSFAR
jgi:hypothetical protein